MGTRSGRKTSATFQPPFVHDPTKKGRRGLVDCRWAPQPGGLVRGPIIFIILTSFLFEFLIPFPSSFCLGRNPIFLWQISFIFSVRPAGGVHRQASGFLLREHLGSAVIPLALLPGASLREITPDLLRAGGSPSRARRNHIYPTFFSI